MRRLVGSMRCWPVWLRVLPSVPARGNAGVVSDAVRVDRIARLEKIKAAAGALQMAESVRFAQSQAEAQLAANVHPDRIGRGIADQLGLACRVSGFEAARRLGVARALWFDLPGTYRLLVAGQISEYVASLVVSETRHLDAETKAWGGWEDHRCWDLADGASERGGVCPQARLPGGSGGLRAARTDRTEEPSSHVAAGAGHDECAVGISAR